MKLRWWILAIVAASSVGGCASSSNPVNVNPNLDTTAPPSPGQISASFETRYRRTRIAWESSAAPDVESYQIFTYDPDPYRDSAYALYGETQAPLTRFDMPSVTRNTTIFVRIRAVDTAGNASAFSPVVPVVLHSSNYDDP